MKIVHKTDPRGPVLEMKFDPDNKLLLLMHNGETPGFAIGWRLDGRWYYQHLMWSCRAGRQFWFRPMIAFYRYIRKNKITDYGLHCLACAENRFKHGGYAIRTEGYRSYLAAKQQTAARSQRYADVAQGIHDAMMALPIGERWTVSEEAKDFYVINERTRATGVVTECITVRAIFDSIFVTRITGVSSRANDPDPFRQMKLRSEKEPIRINDEQRAPASLVDDAMREVARLMSTRCDAEWAARSALAA